MEQELERITRSFGGGAEYCPRSRRAVVALLALVTFGAPQAHPQTLDEARALHRAGRLQEALAAYRAVARSVEESDPEGAAIAFNNACVVEMDLGDHRGAEQDCLEALRLRRQTGDEPRLARTLNNLGLALQNLGRYEEARRRYREALEINRRLGDPQGEVFNLANLGTLATQAGRYGEALALHGAAREVALRHATEPWAAEQLRVALLNRGVVLEKVGAFREALASYRQVLAAGADPDSRSGALLRSNMGVIYRNLGDPVRAVELFEQAAASYRRLGDASGLSNTLLNAALAYHLDLARPEVAEDHYRQALELAVEAGDRPEEIQDLFYLARLLLDLGRVDEAERAFGRCLAAAEESGSAEGRWSALAGLGRIAASRGDPVAASRLLRQAMAKIEEARSDLAPGSLRADFFGDKRFVYAAAVQALGELAAREPAAGHDQRALETVQQAKVRSLLDALGRGGRSAAPEPAMALVEQAGRDVLLEYFAAERDLFRWTVRADGIRMTNLGPAGPVLAAARQTHEALAAGGPPDPETLAGLAATLLPADLLATPPGRLRIAADGALRYLPFELLPAPGRPHDTLIERVAVSYLPSASALRRTTGPLAPTDLVVAGFGAPATPAAGGETGPAALLAARFDLPPLPASVGELASLGRWIGGRSETRTGGEATEEAFRRLAPEARVLHLATHTVIDERPGRGAAILLSPDGADDGLLSPGEVAGLELRAGLTVLAACSTALESAASGNALANLTGSFLAAGSAAVVATLWDVGDRASAAFMEQFYYQLGRGAAPADALRLAKLRLRADPVWGRPHLWAGYVLIGDAPPLAAPRGRRLLWWAAALAALLTLAALTLRRTARGTLSSRSRGRH